MKKRLIFLLLPLLLLTGVFFAACDSSADPQTPPLSQGDPCESGHSYGVPVQITAPTCTAAGSEKSVCTVCGAEKTEEIAAAGHTEGEWQIDVEPSCTATGLRHTACSACGIKLVEEAIPMTEHVLADEFEVVRAATCEQTGEQVKRCTACKQVRVTQTISATGHTEEENWVIDAAAGCEENGARHKNCAVCQKLLVSETIPATGHTEGEWQTDVESSCTAMGSRHTACTDCGKTLSTEDIPMTEHVLADEFEVVRAATCEQAGEQVKRCTVCKQVRVTQTISATGHTEGAWVIDKNASCTETGSKHTECTTCEKTLSTENIPMIAHTLADEYEIVRAATCEQAGEQVKKCTVCKQVRETQTIPATGHIEGEWMIDKNASCTETGIKHTECTACEKTLSTENIPMIAHTLASEFEVVRAATCEQTGEQVKKCTVCKEIRLTQTIPAKGHSEGKTWIVDTPATCVKSGTRHKECSTCRKVLVRETVAATGHTEGTWKIDKSASCTQEGSKHTECVSCGVTLSVQTIPVTEHTLASKFETVREATCEQAGERVKKCTVCGQVRVTQSIPATGHVNTYWCEELQGGTATDRMEKRCSKCKVLLELKQKESLTLCSGTISTVDLSRYTRIVYPTDASDAFAARVGELARALYALTGKPITAVPDTEAATTYEILIGRVARAEVATALADVTGQGYTVQYLNNKIVITGSTNLTALMGLAYFENTYMQSGTQINMPQKAISDRYLSVTVAEGSNIYYTPLYGKDLDADEVYHDNADPETEYDPVNFGTGRDYAVDAALLIRNALMQITGAQSLDVLTDAASPKAGEIQIGNVSRDEMRATLSALEGGYYAIAVKDGQLVLAAHGVAALSVAAPLLAGYLADAVYTDAQGNKSVLLPVNFSFVEKANENWFTDFEKPEELSLTSAEDAGESSLQYYYAGSHITKSHFDAYCEKLEAAGYRLLTASNAEGSYFATYLSANGKHTLHVSYHAYAHAENSNYSAATPSLRVVSATLNDVYAYIPPAGSSYSCITTYPGADTACYTYYNKEEQSNVGKSFFTTTYKNKLTSSSAGYRIIFESSVGAHPFYIAYNPQTQATVRVVYGASATFTYTANSESKTVQSEYVAVYYTARGVVCLPSETLLQKEQSYEKKTDAAITSVVLADPGTGYIITLEDGRFVILDGGSARNNTPERLWAILCDLHVKIHGEAPSVEKPIQIAAWYLSHSHGDHMNALWDFANFYGGGNGGNSKTGDKALVKVEYVLVNEPAGATLYNTGGASLTWRYEMRKIRNYFGHGFTMLKVHTGQKLYFANLEIDIMYTHEDLYPCKTVTFNDVSTMARLTFTPTKADGSKGEEVSLLFTGDAYLNSARWMCAMYGSYLQSDMVTMAHHGGPGAESRFYDLIAPKVVWWPHVKSSVYGGYLKTEASATPANNFGFHNAVDQHVFYDIQSVDYIYISDSYNITLYLRAAGPDYNNLYATDFEKDADGKVTSETLNKVTASYYELPRTFGRWDEWYYKNKLLSNKPIAIKKK